MIDPFETRCDGGQGEKTSKGDTPAEAAKRERTNRMRYAEGEMTSPR